jgi:hypothetical protein
VISFSSWTYLFWYTQSTYFTYPAAESSYLQETLSSQRGPHLILCSGWNASLHRSPAPCRSGPHSKTQTAPLEILYLRRPSRRTCFHADNSHTCSEQFMTGRFLHTKSALQKIPVKRHSEVLRQAISGSEQEGEIACVFEFCIRTSLQLRSA